MLENGFVNHQVNHAGQKKRRELETWQERNGVRARNQRWNGVCMPSLRSSLSLRSNAALLSVASCVEVVLRESVVSK